MGFVAMFSYALFGWRIYLDSWPKEKFYLQLILRIFYVEIRPRRGRTDRNLPKKNFQGFFFSFPFSGVFPGNAVQRRRVPASAR